MIMRGIFYKIFKARYKKFFPEQVTLIKSFETNEFQIILSLTLLIFL